MLDLFERLFNRKVELLVLEDNQATIKILEKGYSPKLRHVLRVHKVNLGCISELTTNNTIKIEYCRTDDQVADIFTKGVPPNKWPNAMDLLGVYSNDPQVAEPRPRRVKAALAITSVAFFLSLIHI